MHVYVASCVINNQCLGVNTRQLYMHNNFACLYASQHLTLTYSFTKRSIQSLHQVTWWFYTEFTLPSGDHFCPNGKLKTFCQRFYLLHVTTHFDYIM